MLVPFQSFTAIAAPIDIVNVDTDQLIPMHQVMEMKRDRPDYAQSLFYDHRFDDAGREQPGFVLNQPFFRDASILVAAENFGCGSSREHAVWALADFGVRAIIAVSFGDIFFENCAKNGLLAIRMDADICADIRSQLHRSAGAEMTIDLPQQIVILPDGRRLDFEIDAFRKECLMRGIDDIDFTLDYGSRIAAWEDRRNATAPWTGPVTDASRSSGPLPRETIS